MDSNHWPRQCECRALPIEIIVKKLTENNLFDPRRGFLCVSIINIYLVKCLLYAFLIYVNELSFSNFQKSPSSTLGGLNRVGDLEFLYNYPPLVCGYPPYCLRTKGWTSVIHSNLQAASTLTFTLSVSGSNTISRGFNATLTHPGPTDKLHNGLADWPSISNTSRASMCHSLTLSLPIFQDK